MNTTVFIDHFKKHLRYNKKFAWCLLFCFFQATAHSTLAFTQSGVGIGIVGNSVPMGHEWITRYAMFEVIGGDPIPSHDPDDPRIHWRYGIAKNITLGKNGNTEVHRIKKQTIKDNRYASHFLAGYSAIVGERWVDLAGFNITKSHVAKYDCWNAVAQQPADLQQDHFMRRYDDNGAEGGVTAALRSQQRFIQHFVNAAIAKPQNMNVWDGGSHSANVTVDFNYFLFGRAIHVFQDAFSSEHTVRIAEDNYESIRQVKSNFCATGAEQHMRGSSIAVNYKRGDVIWNPGTRFSHGWQGYKPSNMKPLALVAVEASKDLWAAFIRTMGLPQEQRHQAAHYEAEVLVANWLAINIDDALSWYDNENHRDSTYVLTEEDIGQGIPQSQCVKDLGVKSGNQWDKIKALKKVRNMCLFNVTHTNKDIRDPYLHMPFDWRWKSKTQWLVPPDSWQPFE